MKGTKFLSSKAILGIVTAVAVVVTVAGSFAAWDTLNVTQSASSVTVREPAIVSLTKATLDYTETNNAPDSVGKLNAIPTFTKDVEFTTQFPLSADNKLDFKISVTGNYGETGLTDGDFVITVKPTAIVNAPTLVGPDITKGSDNSWTTNTALAHTTYNKKALSYTVTIKPNESSTNNFDGVKAVTFSVKGEFIDHTAP
ncbi:hypothetical protein [Eubacterium aggregans]|uniref:hypothetical protein n=1 Tax=Eubacterium aggregans TaxID=81409 RepID=UPI0023F00AF5|nr:hypothetical protein [Eubacterium aggregans]MDD4691721.1 hypothetical protein [Eubacterium aggregans]